MADGIDAAVHASQSSVPNAPGDAGVGDPRIEELRACDDAVLGVRERRYRERGGLWSHTDH
jgi:hypothetical protein